MLDHHLRTLLEPLLADAPSGHEVAAARRGLVAAWGDAAAGLLGDDDLQADAAAVLELLGGEDAAWSAPLRSALQAEHPEADVAAAVMASLQAPAPSVAQAVAHEAGRAPELAAGLDPDALPLARAVVWEAGPAPELAERFDPHVVPLRPALSAEAGAAPELAAGFDPAALPVAEAVAAEAGTVDVTAAVLARVTDPDGLPEAWLSGLLDRELPEVQHVRAAERATSDPRLRARLVAWADVGRTLREDLQREAGPTPAVWQGVAGAIGVDPERVEGWDEALLGQALRAEAGAVDVARQVLDRIRRDARAPEPAVPAPANRGWVLGTAVVAAAAAAGLVLVASRLLGASPGDGLFEERSLVDFASADEISVDRVRYGENASVFVEVPEDDDMPVVIWVDDGGSL